MGAPAWIGWSLPFSSVRTLVLASLCARPVAVFALCQYLRRGGGACLWDRGTALRVLKDSAVEMTEHLLDNSDVIFEEIFALAKSASNCRDAGRVILLAGQSRRARHLRFVGRVIALS